MGFPRRKEVDLIDPRPFMWIAEYQPFQTAKPMIDTHSFNSCSKCEVERFCHLEEVLVTMLEIEGFQNGPD